MYTKKPEHIRRSNTRYTAVPFEENGKDTYAQLVFLSYKFKTRIKLI